MKYGKLGFPPVAPPVLTTAQFPSASNPANGIEVGDMIYCQDTAAYYTCVDPAADTWRVVGPVVVGAGLVNGATGTMSSNMLGSITPGAYVANSGSYSFTVTDGRTYPQLIIQVTMALSVPTKDLISAIQTGSNAFAVHGAEFSGGMWPDHNFYVTVYGLPTLLS